MDNEAIVKEVAKDYGIPEYIWKPILATESGGDASRINSTSDEYSIGLFQVNTFSHPEYSITDLFDPRKNAEITMRDFIKPAINYLTGRGVNNPKDLAVGVYSGIDPKTGTYYDSRFGGIRPSWTDEVKKVFMGNLDQSILNRDKAYQDSLQSGNPTDATGGGQGQENSILSYFPRQYTKIGIIMGLIALSIYLVLSLMKVDPVVIAKTLAK